MQALRPIPVRPDYSHEPRPDLNRSLARAAAAMALNHFGWHAGNVESAEAICERMFSGDRHAAVVLKAASAPATMTTSGWADTLAVTVIGSFLASLKDSAAATLINRAPRVDLTGAGSILLPRATANGSSGWIPDGGPIPLAAGTLANATLAPRKLSLLQSLTRESLEHSPEQWMQTVLADSATAALDTALFSNVAGDATRPPGLTAGISAITASTATVGQTACVADFRALADSIAAVAGGELLFFASPGRAIAAQSYLPALAPQIFGSAFIPSTALYAVAVGAFVSAWDAVPAINVSTQATAHFEDTTPLNLATGAQGSGVVATPSRSAFQQDLALMKMTLKCGWNLRVPNAAAWISAAMLW